MYVDQPVGTGLSYLSSSSNLTTTIDEIADNFFYALNELVNNSVSTSPFNDNYNPCSIFKNITEVIFFDFFHLNKYIYIHYLKKFYNLTYY